MVAPLFSVLVSKGAFHGKLAGTTSTLFAALFAAFLFILFILFLFLVSFLFIRFLFCGFFGGFLFLF